MDQVTATYAFFESRKVFPNKVTIPNIVHIKTGIFMYFVYLKSKIFELKMSCDKDGSTCGFLGLKAQI